MTKLELQIIEAICVIGFIIIFVKFPEMDLLAICKRYNITNTVFGFILVMLALFGIWVHRYSTIISVILFIVFFIVFKTRFTFIELFASGAGETPETTQSAPKLLTAQEVETAKSFLIKQTAADPNKTPLEKSVIDDVINTYFSKSNKLRDLKDFNVASLVNNPLPGDSSIV